MSALSVGIDLGTTHTVVAVAPRRAGATPEVEPVAQLVSEGEVERRPLLPSVLFAPAPGEAYADPWGDAPFVVGAHAKARGARAPGRAVLSPKSWLSHAAVDRLAPILPWSTGAPDPDLPRLSPVEASRRVLAHVRRAFDAERPETPLAAQDVVLTVPASFDEVARELTVRAAEDAGLRVRLLEEPLAAFHDYLSRRGVAELGALVGDGVTEALVLVCDVGGGTTDLTLVKVRREGGGVRLDRVAVGRHLLLGGDNMDLALAHSAEARLGGERLEPALFTELVLACRAAKERLLAGEAPESVPIRVLGRGSALVGSTLATSLERADAERIVLDGFFPEVTPTSIAPRSRTGLVAFGLPYEADPAITRHVSAFLERHAAGERVRAVLLNGGVFRSPLVRARLLELVRSRSDESPIELASPDPDLAVARGAVAFGLSLAGHGVRVGGGSARGFYVGLAAEGTGRRAVCVVPRGAAEGERHVVRVPGLSLVVGEPVRFDLLASDVATDPAGAVVAIGDAHAPLPPLTASFDDVGGASGRVPVKLEGELTSVGTLDVACVEDGAGEGPPRRFRLAFDLREAPRRPTTLPPASLRPADPRLVRARELVDAVFGEGRADADLRLARRLLRDLEDTLGARATWTTETARALFDALAPLARARKRSADHERAYFMLAGFCLRPGYGFPKDDRRVARIAPLFVEFVAFPEEARGWQQFFIAWRRIAGGLGEPLQTAIRDAVDAFLSTDAQKPKKKKGLRPQALDEMLELASSLERLPEPRRADLGRWILERTWTSRDPRLWTALGRVGARVPTYASAHHVVAVSTVERWLDHLLREKWDEVPTAGRAAAQMARLTGDRARDVSEGTRRQIAARLAAAGVADLARVVQEVVAVEQGDRDVFFGDSLPVGLVLAE